MSTSLRIFRNTAFQILGQFLHIALSCILLAVLSRYLGVERYGTYSLVFIILSFLVILTDFGINDIVVREISKDKSKTSRMVRDLFVLKLIMGLGSIVLALAIVLLMNYSREVRVLVAVASVSLVFTSLSSVGNIVFRVNLRMERWVIASVAKDIVLVLSTCAVAYLKGTLFTLVLVTLIAHAVNLVFVLILMRAVIRPPTTSFSFAPWKTMFKAAWPLGLAYLTVSLYAGIDTLMLDKLEGKEAVGYYNASYKFVYQAIFFPVAFVNSLFPFMSKYWHEDKEKLKALLQKAYDYVVLLAVPMGCVVTVLAPKLILLVFGEEYRPSIPSLQILIWAVVLMFQSILFGYMMVALDQQKKSLVIDAFALAFNVGLNLVLIPIMSFRGAAVTTVMTELCVCLPTVYIIFRKLKFRLSPIGLLRSCVVGALCAMALVASDSLNLLWQLAICAVCYFGLIHFLKAVPKEDMDILWQRLQRRNAQ